MRAPVAPGVSRTLLTLLRALVHLYGNRGVPHQPCQQRNTMLLLIDNYDSFTYNLVHYVGELGTEVKVVRNDALNVQEAMALSPAGILLSPGPSDPPPSRSKG